MHLKSFVLFVLTGLLLLHACTSDTDKKVTVQGSFTNLSDTQLFIYQVLPESKPLIDSVKTDGTGNFSFEIATDQSGIFTLKQDQRNEIVLVVTQGEKINLQGNGDSFQESYKISGSKNSELYKQYNAFTVKNLKKVDSLSAVFAESRSNSNFRFIKSALDSAYLSIFNTQKKEVISFVNQNPNSLSSLLAISTDFGPNQLLTENSHPELFLKLDSALSEKYPENGLVKAFHARMLALKTELKNQNVKENKLKSGLPAPDISLPNSAGKKISLSSLKGKLTLVYFWSSWNALSRQTNMKLAGIYSKYHSLGFEIYAVSIDSDTEIWAKAFMLDKAYWIQVNDRNGLESEYCRVFNVNAIPKMILIGKNGTIINSRLDFNEVETLIKNNL